jgi:hypothetical protein
MHHSGAQVQPLTLRRIERPTPQGLPVCAICTARAISARISSGVLGIVGGAVAHAALG